MSSSFAERRLSSLDKSRPSLSSQGSSYYRSGIGGAGNYRMIDEWSASYSQIPESLRQHRPSAAFYVGIGGAGNHRTRIERDAQSDIRHSQIRRHHGMGGERTKNEHHGIGGYGNWVPAVAENERSTELSDKPLPYGALDVLQRKISAALAKCRRS